MTLTPKQFNLLATKEDLKNFLTKDEFDREMTIRFDRVMIGIDGLTKKIENFESEMAANLGAHERFENRISKLERHVYLKPAFNN